MSGLSKVILFVRAYLTHRYWRRLRDRARLEAFQRKRLRAHLNWVTRHSPYYRAFRGRPLQEFPIVGKAIFMDCFDQLNTRAIKRADAERVALEAETTRDFRPKLQDITVGLSSGTSGHRGIFLISEQEEVKWTAVMLAEILPGRLFATTKIALFLRANSNLFESLRKGRIEFRFFDLVRPLEELRKSLEDYKPDIIVATSSMLKALSEFKRQGKLDVDPRRLYSTAEVLDPFDQRSIEQSFQQSVFQVYHCTEGFLGISCEHGTIHLNESFIHVEMEFLDDERRRFIPIITDLERETQPIIRYRLNDILTLRKDPCPCGRVFTGLEFIEGREDDVFYFRTPQGEVKRVFPDLIRGLVMTYQDEIREYRVVQKSVDEIEFFIQCHANGSSIQDHLRQRVSEYCMQIGVIAPKLQFSAFVEHARTRKLRRVERAFSLTTEG